MNVTVPSGVAPPVPPATVAVKVTLCPNVDGFRLEVSVVVVPSFTVCVNALDELVVWFVSPM
jgi:hypothetical protein